MAQYDPEDPIHPSQLRPQLFSLEHSEVLPKGSCLQPELVAREKKRA
jgi:hypothetical protein